MQKKVLVVDDDTGLQDIFRLILERAGYEVEVLANGTSVLRHQFRMPDLFLLDKQLSGIDGLDVCKFLKKEPLTSRIPVIMVSANPDIGTLAFKAGADDYIEKPFELTQLVELVRKYTDLRPAA